MKENTKSVIKYLQGLDVTTHVTAADVAEATGLSAKAVNAIFTFSVQNKDLGERIPATVELEDGTTKDVKFLALNDAGRALDCDAEPVEG